MAFGQLVPTLRKLKTEMEEPHRERGPFVPYSAVRFLYEVGRHLSGSSLASSKIKELEEGEPISM